MKKKENGCYKQIFSAVKVDDSISSLAVRSFTRTMIDYSKAALDVFDKENRHISGITMGISRDTYELLTTEIEAFKNRIKSIVNHSSSADRVYQINISLFPLSKQIKADEVDNKGSV